MKCPKCGHEPTLKQIQDSPEDCTQCGVNFAKYRQIQARDAEEAAQKKAATAAIAKASPVVRTALYEYPGAQPVVVVDLKMSFWSMVVFMVKWAIAAIPAVIILALIWLLCASLISAIPAYFSYKDRAEKASSFTAVEPERINAPGYSEREFYLISKESIGSYTTALILMKKPSEGSSVYSRFVVDCALRLAKVTGYGMTISTISDEGAEPGMQRVDEGSPRGYITDRVCRPN